MYKDILRSISGIDVFPVISLLIFVSFFTLVVIWAARMDRRRLAHLSALPLDAEPGEPLPLVRLSTMDDVYAPRAAGETCSECRDCGQCKKRSRRLETAAEEHR